jgi:membrane protease YdiL (CAAX protease family)
MEPPPLVEPRPSVPAQVLDTGIAPSFPVWTLGDVVRVVVVLILSLFFTAVLSVMLASALPAYRTATSAQIATDPRIIVPAQVIAYLVTVWFIYRTITLHYRANFWEAIHWRWPAKWMSFLVGGFCLSILLQVVSHALPIPKKLPIEDFFKTQSGVWLMAVYGTLIAPFTEELFFRGLLYPALVRKIGMPVAIAITSLSCRAHPRQPARMVVGGRWNHDHRGPRAHARTGLRRFAGGFRDRPLRLQRTDLRIDLHSVPRLPKVLTQRFGFLRRASAPSNFLA